MTELRLRIVVLVDGRELTSDLTVDPATPVSVLIERLIRDHGLSGTPADWALTRRGEPLAPSVRAGELVRQAGDSATTEVLTGLVLVRRAAVPPGAPAVRPPATPAPAPQSPPVRAPLPSDFRAPLPPNPGPWLAPSPAGRARARPDEDYDEGDADADRVRRKGRMVTRRATVRYYSRMNPERMYPLLVVLSAEEIEQVVKKAVKQAESAGFKVEEGSQLVVEPVLPGCDCYPPAETIPADPQPVTAAFWVVPRVLGRVSGARVVLRQNGRVLSEVPLDIKVSRQTAALVFGLLGLFAPYLAMALKVAKLDFESQQQDGFPVYRMAGAWCAENVRPEWLGFGLLGLAILFYLWARPRRRDVFWDVTPKSVGA